MVHLCVLNIQVCCAHCQKYSCATLLSFYYTVLLKVNGHDLTMATHKKAVEYIGRKPVLNLLVYRKGMPQLQPKQAVHQTSSYQSYPAGYRQQQQQQQPVAQSASANQPYYRQY